MKNTAVLFGASGVLLGALGAHGLGPVLSETALNSFKTGILYQLIHAVALLALPGHLTNKWTVQFWTWGILCFSFSIYFLSVDELFGLNLSFLGPITPIGGLLLIAGWLSLFKLPKS
jgi:uncharacterized membrane protein YgdD (TMEM256/DUF423 family)